MLMLGFRMTVAGWALRATVAAGCQHLPLVHRGKARTAGAERLTISHHIWPSTSPLRGLLWKVLLFPLKTKMIQPCLSQKTKAASGDNDEVQKTKRGKKNKQCLVCGVYGHHLYSLRP